MPVEELSIQLTGLNMDTVYEGFVRQIAGDLLQDAPTETLKDSVEKAEQKATLEKQIAALQGKIRKEKQLNRQVEMNTELKRLRKELETLQ
jgi:TolA-binding protein